MAFRKKNAAVFILITFLLWGSLVYRVDATDVFASVKFGLDIAAKAAAHGAFQAITNRILNKVKTGGVAGALFVQDWRDFQLKAQYRGEDIWRGILYFAANGDGSIPPLICDYIRNSSAFRSLQPREINNAGLLALNRRVDSLQEFITASKCDSSVNQKYDIFIKNFARGGGWDTWEKLLQPQNNIYGIIEMASDELVKQRKIEEMVALNEARAGSGFTGIRKCLANAQGTSACAILGRIKTPGSTIGEQVASVFDANLKFYTTADAASLAVAAVTEFLVGKLIDQGLSPDPGTPADGFNPGTDPKEVESSYKSEFCSARDNMTTKPAALYIFKESKTGGKYPNTYKMFPPEEDRNAELSEADKKPRNAWNDNDVGKSYCKWRYDKDDNKDPFTRCMRACYQKLKLSEGNNLLTPEHIGSNGWWIDAGNLGNPEGGGGGGGGSGVCANKGGTADYAGALRSAIDAVIAANPGGIADALNTAANGFKILDLVSAELQGAGFNATTGVKNGNDNPNQGDLIAVWRSGDSTIERYDAITNSGAGTQPLRDVMGTDYTGDIPLSCAS